MLETQKEKETSPDLIWELSFHHRSSVTSRWSGAWRQVTDQTARYEFQRLNIYQLGLDYVEPMYALTQRLPRTEDLNLRSQLQRAVTSIVLNIAEGSTSQSDAEQACFLGLALRALMECVACLDLVERHDYATDKELVATRELGHQLFVKIQALRRTLDSSRGRRPGPRSPVCRRSAE